MLIYANVISHVHRHASHVYKLKSYVVPFGSEHTQIKHACK